MSPIEWLAGHVFGDNFEEYSGDIVTALTPNKWRTKTELDDDVAQLRLKRFNEKNKGIYILSIDDFYIRHIVGVSSPIVIRKALAKLVKEQFVVHQVRTAGLETGHWEYGLHPTRRLPVMGGKRTPRLTGALAGAAVRAS